MSLSIRAERGLVSQDEFETLSQTHHPRLHDLSDADLTAAQRRIRDLRAKERTLARDLRRSIRGKAETRGGSFPGMVEKPARRKGVFAAALKRLNAEVSRRRAIAARDALKDTSRRALRSRKAARRHHPAPGRTGHGGMTPNESERGRTQVPPAKVGSVSQATKAAQATKDSRG
ncbi:hypothetical protein MMB17_18765 [Methylobacterium organophilum]|uniref:hypothetical protein n=1 Tax=Methylobacterium organophilum TaxID=410 RepID=UPI001F12B486|nr:hypothetical protein [Methylobacterium organophilum]UMY16705.1 hypothetical protein MMB17_18765 [Methylobacterium organophilum]